MAETSVDLPSFSQDDLPENVTVDAAYANRFTQATLEKHKREGLQLALRARWVALAVVAVMLPFLNPSWDVLYFEAMLLLVALIGLLHRRVGRVGRSRPELAVLGLDLMVVVSVVMLPNPFVDWTWPHAMILRFDVFNYLFIFLALGTLSYSWRTILAMGNWTAGLWAIGLGLMWWFGTTSPELSEAAQQAFGHDSDMLALLDPNRIMFDIRIQQIVVFVIVAGILALSIRRFNRLLVGNAALERERENLARYFSPNVVEELSQNDQPLRQIRSHDVAAIFVDIHGFTRYANMRAPEEVIATLRDLHGRMERAVFAQNGTLDKFLGDGLMATFGTPLPAPDDVRRAYHCTRRMVDLAAEWNTERAARGEEHLTVSIGLHYGAAVLGDIGGNRLEFAVIGNTVNIASRLEGLTRDLGARLVISQEVFDKLPQEETSDLRRVENQHIKGLDQPITVWTLA